MKTSGYQYYQPNLVAVENGVYYDTWDSGDKCLYGYWEKQ